MRLAVVPMSPLERERRPADNGASDISTAAKTDIILRRQWAYSLIRRATMPPPRYGSAEWNALPLTDPARVAGCVVAAESWALDGENLGQRLTDEVAQLREAFTAEEDAAYVARAEAHRRAAPRFSTRSFAERRAEQLAAIAPREGDYPGRGVS